MMLTSKSTLYKPLIGQSIQELESFVVALGQRSFRGRQLFDWIYRQRVDDYNKMTDLSNSFRKKLINFPLHSLKLIERDISPSKKTRKFLFQLNNGKRIESVIMKSANRITVCLSTQVGCAVDCDFCATAKMGFVQNLSVGEIIDQFFQLQKIIETPITNVVFMGMGEPFLNYKNCIDAAHLLHDPLGINLGAKRITISTAGLIKKIELYTKEGHPFKLAVSLNGSDQGQRIQTMPIARKNTFPELLRAIKNYTLTSRKKVTIEYVLLAGVNDKQEDAQKIKNILSSINCKLNLIPYNEIGGKYNRPPDKTIITFLKQLKNAPFPTTIRWSKGQDIDAGCGQLVTGIS